MARTIQHDVRPSEYGPFMTDGFARRISEAAVTKPKLRQAVFDLIAIWRGTSCAVALPRLIPHAIADAINGYEQGSKNDRSSPHRIDATLQLLARRVPEITDESDLRDRLRTAIEATAEELNTVVEHLPPTNTREQVWSDYAQDASFMMGLDQTMRNGYVSVFAAYESFVTTATSIALDGEKVRVTPANAFHEKLQRAFGGKAKTIWHEEETKTAKLVRHAMIHAGGRETDDVRTRSHGLIVDGGILYVFPANLRRLYQHLSEGVWTIVNAKTFDD